MLQLLKDIIERFQWPKVREEIRRLFPETLRLVEKMETELQRVVMDQVSHGAYGANIACLTREVTVYMSGLKMAMEGCARISLNLPCSKKILDYLGADKDGFSLTDGISNLENLSRNLIFKIDCEECVFWPLITRKPLFFIKEAISDPWFVGSSTQALKMVGG